MYHNISLKDLEAVSTSFDLCTVGSKYKVLAFTNNLEGDINAVVKVISSEDSSLGRTCLFSFRNGEQISTNDLNYNDQLIIPDEDIARIKQSLSVRLNMLGMEGSIWERTIEKINSKHTDSNSNYQLIPANLPIPEFHYLIEEKKEDDTISNDTPKKESFFKRLFGKKKTENKQ